MKDRLGRYWRQGLLCGNLGEDLDLGSHSEERLEEDEADGGGSELSVKATE